MLVPRAGAGAGPLELAWDAPSGCPTQEDVLAEVLRLVGSAEVRRSVQAEAQVERRGERWVVTLRTRQGGGAGERSLEGHTCEAVASASALVLALTLQTDAPEPPPPATVAPPPANPPRAPAPAIAPRRTKPAVALRAAGGLALGIVPGAGGCATGAVGLRYGRAEVSANFVYVSETSQTVSSRPNAGGRFSLLGTSVLACVAPVAGSDYGLEVWGCAGAGGEWMLARAFGVTTSNDTVYGWFAPVVAARVAYAPVRKFAMFVESTFSFPLVKPRFTVEGLEPVYRVPPVGLRLLLGVELRY